VTTLPKERPILFSAPMVCAILDGSKTQTRRVVKPVRRYEHNNICRPDLVEDPYAVWWHGVSENVGCFQICPYGTPGDRLWVRETWAYERDGTGCPDDTGILYRATDPGWDDEETGLRWRPSIHMPRRAFRILLEITDIRVQRLQEISEEDARAEGYDPQSTDFPALWFHGLWDTIHGSGAWHANPWVWAITLRLRIGSARRIQP
jgi:hypothetical protein